MQFSQFLGEMLNIAKRDENGNVVLTEVAITDSSGTRLNVEELALFSVVDLIAAAASLCEWRTYQNGERVRGNDWYAFNVQPNPNQNATEFKRLLIARLLIFNEALVFERNGSYYLADSFVRDTYAFRPNVYRNITCGNLSLSAVLTEPDVWYFRNANQKASSLVAHLQGLYSKALNEALSKYEKSGGRSGIVEISGTARGRPTFEQDLEKLMNDRFKRFFENKNAVLPLYDGFKYTPHDGPATQKSVSEVSDMESIFRQAQDRFCNAFHVPPSILRGDVTNQDDAINVMLSFGVKPPLKIIETEVNRKTYGKAVLDGWQMRINTTNIKTVDVFSVAEKADKLIQDRLYNPNGMRELFGDEPIPEPWADEYTMTKNMEVVNT